MERIWLKLKTYARVNYFLLGFFFKSLFWQKFISKTNSLWRPLLVHCYKTIIFALRMCVSILNSRHLIIKIQVKKIEHLFYAVLQMVIWSIRRWTLSTLTLRIYWGMSFGWSMITWRLHTELVQSSPFRLITLEPWAKNSQKQLQPNVFIPVFIREQEQDQSQ